MQLRCNSDACLENLSASNQWWLLVLSYESLLKSSLSDIIAIAVSTRYFDSSVDNMEIPMRTLAFRINGLLTTPKHPRYLNFILRCLVYTHQNKRHKPHLKPIFHRSGLLCIEQFRSAIGMNWFLGWARCENLEELPQHNASFQNWHNFLGACSWHRTNAQQTNTGCNVAFTSICVEQNLRTRMMKEKESDNDPQEANASYWEISPVM
jgi:hypothetical protein